MSFSSNSISPYFQHSTIQTVTDVTRSIKLLLENGFSFISVNGEVSNIRKPYSGHLYFTLKDDISQLKAVLFKPQQRYLSKELSNGDQIICRGRISVYEPRGEYQIIVDSVEFAGEGDLQLAYEQLKKKLDAEGLFKQEHKKEIPYFPKGISLITSPTGAAVHDFLTIAQSRFAGLPIEIYPVPVQGDEATKEIIQAVQEANQRDTTDVIVISRGGGSIEDLWPFNDENLARCVYQSDIPVVSAIGHEIDFTILDFVADMRAPTPSAAAEIVIPSRIDLKNRVDQYKEKLAVSMTQRIKECQHSVSLQERLLKDPTALLQNLRLRIDQLQNNLLYSLKDFYNHRSQRLNDTTNILRANTPQQKISGYRTHLEQLKRNAASSFENTLMALKAKISNAATLLGAVNPKAVLNRGYAIVFTEPEKEVVRSSRQATSGKQLSILTGDGTIKAKVTKAN